MGSGAKEKSSRHAGRGRKYEDEPQCPQPAWSMRIPPGLCLRNGADVKQLELGKTKSKKEGKTVGDCDSRDCVVLLGHGWQWGARAALCPDSLWAESPRLPEFPFPLAVQQ